MMVINAVTSDSRVINEATSLASNGYELTVLAFKIGNAASEERINGFAVKRFSSIMRYDSFLGSLELYLKLTLAAIRQNADIYHAHDTSTLLQCYIAARLRHAPIIYDSHEVSVDQRGSGLRNSFRYSFSYLIEKLLIGRVNAVITVNSYIAKHLENRYHLKKSIFIIMNCPSLKEDLQSGKTIKNAKCLDELIIQKQKNRKIIVYQGAIVEGRCLKQLVEAMQYLPDKYCLFIMGAGAFLPELKMYAESNNLNEKIFFPGLISLEQLPYCTELSDVGVTLVEGLNLNHYYSSPNKLFQYIHANIPIIARDFPFLKEVIEGCDIGRLIHSTEPAEIANAIKAVLEDDTRYLKMKSNTVIAKERYNWEKESKVLLEIYRKINSNNN